MYSDGEDEQRELDPIEQRVLILLSVAHEILVVSRVLTLH